ncbi:Chaperone protein DnaJ [Aquisphaera giovannonii]|uniref:Chaperone protein DnaJ n=1 Tax=Aquisphaera giovannonii TaxID=406548 RepID=A0A5B9W5J7_9BACT|nr:J domain-containing protein [Aquisphaera giovannonii]QEH35250.1 Chaperone protein DnaJ [Aquisphaera giovannonii]
MNHHFSLDPRTILGVGPGATAEEIDRAFRAKSKKHHPDVGGDEWAFRMVRRAHEILTATSEMAGLGGGFAPAASPPPPAWAPGPPPTAGGWDGSAAAATGTGPAGTWGAGAGAAEATATAPPTASSRLPSRAEFQTVDAELIWIRFDLRSAAAAGPDGNPEVPGDSTLSVCLVVSWPRTSLVKHSAEFPDAAETLHEVIEAFERLRAGGPVLGSRSRIEDGQFVGWLSYPNVVQAQIGVESLRDGLRGHDLRLSLQTRDEPLPTEWLAGR